MKIKFEIRLTASRALLAVLSAMVGLSAQAEEKEAFKEVVGSLGEPVISGVDQKTLTPVQEEQVKARATRTRAAAPRVDPIPEKIVPPAPQKAEEVAENLPPQAESEDEGAPAITIEEVRGFGGSLIQKNDVKFRPMVMAVLHAHGASKFSELDPSEFAGTLADLKAIQ